MTQDQRDEVMNLPLVKQVVDLFDAQLVDLRRTPNGAEQPAQPETEGRTAEEPGAEDE